VPSKSCVSEKRHQNRCQNCTACTIRVLNNRGQKSHVDCFPAGGAIGALESRPISRNTSCTATDEGKYEQKSTSSTGRKYLPEFLFALQRCPVLPSGSSHRKKIPGPTGPRARDLSPSRRLRRSDFSGHGHDRRHRTSLHTCDHLRNAVAQACPHLLSLMLTDEWDREGG
jgi:hypothetical protein